MTIKDTIRKLTPTWHQPNIDVQVRLSSYLGLKLPDDYVEFMMWSNGGESSLVNGYLALWSMENVERLNNEYKITQYLGNSVVAIGTDGGPIAFLLDYRDRMTPSFSSVNLGDLDPAEIKILASDFLTGLRMLVSGEINGDTL